MRPDLLMFSNGDFIDIKDVRGCLRFEAEQSFVSKTMLPDRVSVLLYGGGVRQESFKSKAEAMRFQRRLLRRIGNPVRLIGPAGRIDSLRKWLNAQLQRITQAYRQVSQWA